MLFRSDKVAEKPEFETEVQDVTRGGLRIILLENGASMFIPASTLHDNREEITINNDEIAFYIKDQRQYKIGDLIRVQLTEVKETTRSIIGIVLK